VSVLLDTSVWSIFLRRRRKRLTAAEKSVPWEVGELIKADDTVLIGPVRQELLTGIRDERHFETLRDYLSAFDDERLATEDYETAARWANDCRREGVSGSAIDFLICAVAIRRALPVFTTDDDFARYAGHIPLVLHVPTNRKT
jgi:predicted nucleic acid-binding protein